MENQIDKFFKDKLENHSLSPSEEAWTKVEAKLSKKNSVIAWRLAAAILLAGAFVSLIYWSQRKEESIPQTIAGSSSQKENKSVQPNVATPSRESEQLVIAKEQKSIHQNVSPKKKSPVTPPQSLQTEEKIGTQSIVEVKKDNPVVAVRENIPEEKIISEATPAINVASTRQKPIKLEFTLDDFTSEEKVATTNEVKNTGIKKVWELAKEVKNGEGPIREIKNELFALNFKKTKTKN